MSIIKHHKKSKQAQPLESRRLSRFYTIVLLILSLALVYFALQGIIEQGELPTYEFIRQSIELSQDRQVQEWQKAVVTVDNGQIRGTGFNIAHQGVIVTNSHLLDDAEVIDITFSNGKRFSVRKWDRYEDIDLAIVRLDDADLPLLTIDETLSPYSGDEVIVIGNPLGFTRIANRSLIKGYTSFRETKTKVMIISGHLYKGNSGSPLINEQGLVVGMLFGTAGADRDERNKTIGLALPTSEIVRYLG